MNVADAGWPRAPVVDACLIVVLILVGDVAPVQAQMDALDGCTEKMIAGSVGIGHDFGEWASIVISGRLVHRRPWSRVVSASRAERLRARREGRAPRTGRGSTETASGAPPVSARVIIPASSPVTPPASTGNCDPAYPDVCIASPPPNLNCADVPDDDFTVLSPDPHGFDGDNDGTGCKT